MPPAAAPSRMNRDWLKNTQDMVENTVWVLQPKSNSVGPRKATHMPKLQNTKHSVMVVCLWRQNRSRKYSRLETEDTPSNGRCTGRRRLHEAGFE
ncbi:hypothetical protein MRX96_029652 [Rhipicephalus microplus]